MIEPKEFSGGVNGLPMYDDRKAMWSSLDIKQVSINFPALKNYAMHLEKLYVNGSVKYGCFELGESEVLDWYCARNQLKALLFFQKIWHVPEIENYFNLSRVDKDADKFFEYDSPFVFDGRLASILAFGGAYEEISLKGIELKRLGEEVAQELIEDDYGNILTYFSNFTWCDFFFGVAWDTTFVVLNKQKRLLTILMATDTD